MKNTQNEKAIILTILALAVFFSACLIGIFGQFGNLVSNFLIGFFGYTAYAVVFCTLIVCVILLFGGQVFVAPKTAIKYVGLLCLLVLALHVATSKQFFEQSFFAYLKSCFDSCATAGGMLFGIIAYLPTKIFTYGGALAIFSLAFLITSFFALGKEKQKTNNFRSKKIIYGSKNTATLTEFDDTAEKEQINNVGATLFVGSIEKNKESKIFQSKNATNVINYEPIDSIFNNSLSGNGLLDEQNNTEDEVEDVPAPVLEADVRQQAYDKLFNFQKTYTPSSSVEDITVEETPRIKYVPRATSFDDFQKTTSIYSEEQNVIETKENDVIEEEQEERPPIPKLNLTFESNPYTYTNNYFNKQDNSDKTDIQNTKNEYSSFDFDNSSDSYSTKLSSVLNALNT
ncbi:MAG: hypothetical protein IKC83_03245, partial [Clostridia bacterium]|nr:hypothetical protein [Clostridia bacterium]